MSLLVPIASLNPWQRIKMRDKATNLMVGGYTVVAHNKAIAPGIVLESMDLDGMVNYRLTDTPGATVVANQGQHRGATGWRFYTVPSTTLVQLDE